MLHNLLVGALALTQPIPPTFRPLLPTHARHTPNPAACDAPPTPHAQTPAADAAPTPKPKTPKTPIETIEPNSMLTGTVRSVQSYGAFIDIGATTDGLLHVSEMSDNFVKDANELFKVGDAVEVRVKSVDLEKKQVALTKKSENAPARGGGGGGGRGRREKADLTEFESADEKAFVTGKVRSLQSFGAFVQLKEGVDGLVHISQIKDGGVGSVEEELSEGQEVQVRVISFDKSSGRIGLSMRPWTEPTEEEIAAKKAGRRPPRRGRDDGDDDSAFKLSSEDLEALTLDFEEAQPSAFAAAFARQEEKAAAKSEGRKFLQTL